MVRLHQFPQPTEGIHYRSDNMAAVVDSKDLGEGSLYVTEGNVSWINGTSGEGFSILYPKMTLHAITKDETIHPKPCLYIMLNGYLDEDGTKQAEVEPDEETEADDEDEVITEVRFIPEDPVALDAIYKAIQECTLLHPDAASDMTDDEEEEEDDDNEDMEEEDEDEEFEDAEFDQGFGRLMNRFGLNRNNQNEEDPQEDPDQFADAE